MWLNPNPLMMAQSLKLSPRVFMTNLFHITMTLLFCFSKKYREGKK